MENKLNRLVSRATTTHFITIILLVSFGVYFNALFNGFVYDDAGQVLENHWIRDIRFIPDIFTSSVWSFQSNSTVSNYYRPVMHLIYTMNYYIFGLEAWGFHLVNVLFHGGVAVLVFILTRQLLARAGRVMPLPGHPGSSSPEAIKRAPSQSPLLNTVLLPALAASLLFATHPIHTEAVTWIAGLPDLSYTFFTLLSFCLFIKSEDGPKGIYWLSVIAFAVATLCKEPALLLPFILMAYDFSFRPLSKRSAMEVVRYFLKKYFPYFIISGAYLALRYNALGAFFPQESHVNLSTYAYFINVFPLFSQYLEKLFLPLDLNAFHVLHPISSLFEPRGMIAVSVTGTFVALAFAALKKHNGLVFLSLLLIALPLLPTLYIPAVGENVFAERYLYLPSVGFVILLSLFLKNLWKIKQRQLAVFLVFLCLISAYSIGTGNRNATWRDDVRLFLDVVKKSPDAALAHNNLGRAYAGQGRFDAAMREYKIALSINHADARAHYNLGNAYAHQDQNDEAIAEYKMALNIEPDYVHARYNLGVTYLGQNRIDEAIKELLAVSMLEPGNSSAAIFLKACYERKKLINK